MIELEIMEEDAVEDSELFALSLEFQRGRIEGIRKRQVIYYRPLMRSSTLREFQGRASLFYLTNIFRKHSQTYEVLTIL